MVIEIPLDASWRSFDGYGSLDYVTEKEFDHSCRVAYSPSSKDTVKALIKGTSGACIG